MTHGKVRRCHMAPQKSDTWQNHVVHLNEWLTMSHVWEKKFHGSHEAKWVMMS